MNFLLYNTTIFTNNLQVGVLKNSALVIRDAHIHELGNAAHLKEKYPDYTSALLPAITAIKQGGTSVLGHCLIDGAKKLRKDLETHALEELVGNVYEGM